MKKHIRLIFLASFFFSLHLALLTYINSSMLGQFASPTTISITYTLASVLSLVLVGLAPDIIRRIGNMRYVGLGLLFSAILLYFISSHTGFAIIPFFILYFSLNSVILYGLDIFLEHYSSESKTGNIRGTYLTIANIGWVIAPLISGKLQSIVGFSMIYVVASIAVILSLLTILFGQRGFVDRIYKRRSFFQGLAILRKNKNLRIVTLFNLLLQFFFVVMVIYSPVYLTTVIGFSWKSLGILLSVILSAFVIFPYPSGKMADGYIEEKWMILVALILMGGATIVFAGLGNASIVVYTCVLFITRAGASILEIMCESAFFKQVTDADSEVISLYRDMLPFAYTIGPLIAGAFFALTSYQTLFYALGGLMIFASMFALNLTNKKEPVINEY